MVAVAIGSPMAAGVIATMRRSDRGSGLFCLRIAHVKETLEVKGEQKRRRKRRKKVERKGIIN